MAAAVRDSSGPSSAWQQSDPISPLPREIVCEIFTYLDQADYLTGMETCKAWYKLFPEHARHAWSSLRLYPCDHDRENRRFELCLGKHVKTVTFDAFDEEDKLYSMMDKLSERGCTEIESLEFIECASRDQNRFLRYLKPLATHLTRLTMADHNANIAFLRVFDMCTELTHFTYKPSMNCYADCNVYGQEPDVQEPLESDVQEPMESDVQEPMEPDVQETQEPDAHESSKPVEQGYLSIVYLCLDTIIDKRLRLVPILKKCSNLRCLIGASFVTIAEIRRLGLLPATTLYENTAFDLDMLFTWCPKISFLENNRSYSTHNNLQEYRIDKEDQRVGLRHFGVCETDDYNREQIALHLMNHQHTLEHLALSQHTDDNDIGWTGIFQSLRLDQLHTLKLFAVCADVNSIIAMINHCPLLESLTLRQMRITIDSTVIRLLHPVARLSVLKLHDVKLGDMNSVAALLERLPVLERLTIIDTPLFRGPFTVDLLLSTINSHSTHLKYLEVVHMCAENGNSDAGDITGEALDTIYDPTHVFETETIILRGMSMISYGVLQSVAGIESLKCLNVDLDEVACRNDEESLLLFAGMLAGTVLEDLTLSYIRQVPDDVLAAFSELPKLTRLTMRGPQSITDSQDVSSRISGLGLLQLLCTTKSLKNITIEQMRMSAIDNRYAYQKEIEMLERPNGSWIMTIWDYVSDTMQVLDPMQEMDFWLNEQALHNVEFRCI